MPRKTKDQKELELEKENLKKPVVSENKEEKKVKTTVTKKATTKKADSKSTTKSAKKSTAKSATKKATKSGSKSVAKEDTKSTSKNTTKKATKSTSKSANKKPTKSTAKKATKSTTKKPTEKAAKKATRKTTRKSKTAKIEKPEVVEYYDLPYRYNQTVVKVLAQTPTNLFIYWDISDKDRKNFEEQYGEKFFETTRPILIVHNDTLGYSFEVEINDFANSWYLHVNDAKCDYRVELGRRPIVKTEKLDYSDYIYITTSNKIESPNDHILFDKKPKMVYFRNVKTGEQTQKEIASISFLRNMGKIYDIYDLYRAIYNDENIEEIYNLSNPSSGNPSSRKPFIKNQIEKMSRSGNGRLGPVPKRTKRRFNYAREKRICKLCTSCSSSIYTSSRK